MKQSIDPYTLPDELLYRYYTELEPDEEQRSLAKLVPYAVHDNEKVTDVFKKILHKGSKLLAVHGNEKAPSNSTLLGPIIDGTLYLVAKDV